MQLDAVEQVGATQLHHDARDGSVHVVIRGHVYVISDGIARQFPTIVAWTLDELQRNRPDKTHDIVSNSTYLSAELQRRQVDVLDDQEGDSWSVRQRNGVLLLLDGVQNLRFGEHVQRAHHLQQVL